MADWQLIDTDAAKGVRTYVAAGDDDDSALVRHEFSGRAVDAVLDRNKEAQSEGFDKRSDMWHAASIPISVMYDWKVKHGVDAWRYASDPDVRKAVNRLLNSSEYRYLRVRHFMI